MSKRLSVKDVFGLGDALFAEHAPSRLDPKLLRKVRDQTVSSVEPFVDNDWSRGLLSSEQSNRLQERGVLNSDGPPGFKRHDNVFLYLKEYVDQRAYTERGSEDDHLDGSSAQEPERLPLLVLIVFRDTGEAVARWQTSVGGRAL